MTAIALLWSPRRDIDCDAFLRILRDSAPEPPASAMNAAGTTAGAETANAGGAQVLLWDGAGTLVRASEREPAPGRWALALAAIGSPADVGNALASEAETGHALALVGNTRNARPLFRELVRDDAPDGEAACLLGLLARKGATALQELVGEWALAFLDSRQARLSLGNDRPGTEALYYHAAPDRFAAAGSPLSALALAGLPRRGDREWLLACLASGARLLPEEGDTAFADLRRLRPGCTLQVEARQGVLHTDLLRVGLLESFVDLPADPAHLGQDLRAAAGQRLPGAGRLGIAWTGGPGAVATAVLAAQWAGKRARSGASGGVALYALEQSGASGDLAALVARSLDLRLVRVPWPEHPVIESKRAALVRGAGLPLTDPFPALEMDLLCEAMAGDGLNAAWAGTGARTLLGVDAAFAGEAVEALARRRRMLPALALRRALLPPDSPSRNLMDLLGFLVNALAPHAYRSTLEQARIELLAHHAPDANDARLLAFYKQSLRWRELNALRRMQLQRLTRGDGPARLHALRLAASGHGVDLALPLLDPRLARYLRLPLARRLTRGRECPLLLATLAPGLPPALDRDLHESPALVAAAHAPVERLAARPARNDALLAASPLLRALFPDLRALLADLEQLHEDERFHALPLLLDALAEWERECAVEV